MLHIENAEDLALWQKQRTGTWALVPTMGNLHAGHLSLVQEAKKYAEKVVVSIFVNPTQFAANEDFGSYPRTLVADQALLAEAGCDALFLPTEALLYPFGTADCISFQLPAAYTQILCGVRRPSHFQGVINVVSRLFHLIRPQVAVFGEKDFQQQWLIKRFVTEFHENIDIVTAPIIRAADGLALSSRNGYLDAESRILAAQLAQELQFQREALRRGEYDLQTSAQRLEEQGFRVDYLELRRSSDLSPIAPEALPAALSANDARLFIAAYLGSTRLIDNLAV